MPTDFKSLTSRVPSGVWTVVDSDPSNDGAPPRLIPHGTRLFAIHFTTPGWSGMEKTVIPTVVVMNSWTRGEIRRTFVIPCLRFSCSFLDTFSS